MDVDAPGDDDAMSSILVSICSRVGSTEAEEPSRVLDKKGKVCHAQHFSLHEPVMGHRLAANDPDDGTPQLEPDLAWWQGVEELIHLDDEADLEWWQGVEAAIKDEEASEVLAGKRRHEHEDVRAGSSKRPRKPG